MATTQHRSYWGPQDCPRPAPHGSRSPRGTGRGVRDAPPYDRSPKWRPVCSPRVRSGIRFLCPATRASRTSRPPASRSARLGCARTTHRRSHGRARCAAEEAVSVQKQGPVGVVVHLEVVGGPSRPVPRFPGGGGGAQSLRGARLITSEPGTSDANASPRDCSPLPISVVTPSPKLRRPAAPRPTRPPPGSGTDRRTRDTVRATDRPLALVPYNASVRAR